MVKEQAVSLPVNKLLDQDYCPKCGSDRYLLSRLVPNKYFNDNSRWKRQCQDCRTITHYFKDPEYL